MPRKTINSRASMTQDDQHTAPAYIAYQRVSTERQGRSGLGLEAQREAVRSYVAGVGGAVVAEFVEIESGKVNDRPQLARALAECRRQRAVLIVAKLDRLARNVAFISALMESGTEFVACDNPTASKFTIHILAAVAEHEREMISTRTRQALAAAKARGVKLGRAGTADQARYAADTWSAHADQRATALMPTIREIQAAGITSAKGIAGALNARGVPTARGNGSWTHKSVLRVLERAAPAENVLDRVM